MTNFALAEILSLKSWKHALFTTYVLSLTFFESYVLRSLHQQGCREIFLITDADGYQMSLSERRSNRVGQEYRLIPVALPKGVFHPKCLYLSSDSGDLLAVGSGNMTFGGFGRNLEVFDILEPLDAPQAFLDFAEFLELLENRDDFVIPDNTWIERFSSLARNSVKGQSATPGATPTLLHSVVEPIADQVIDVCSSHNGCNKLTVLSPFHDPKGTAIRELAAKASVNQIEIALPPKSGNHTTFPFPEAVLWGIPLSAVKPVGAYTDRPLHAKWMEIEFNDGNKLTLSGSINATSKALCSTDNIEVGVLRVDDSGETWANWQEAQIPTIINKHAYSAAGLGQKCLIHASIRNDGVISGLIIATGAVTGEWFGYLENGNADQVPVVILVDENNQFLQPIPGIEQVIYSSGLQLILTQGERRARGWVNQEHILKLTREQRSIIRLINREETIDDDMVLLDYLSMSANKHLSAFNKPINTEPKSPKSAENETPNNTFIKLSEIAPDSDSFFAQDHSASTDYARDRDLDMFTQLRRRLLGHKQGEKEGTKTLFNVEDDDADHLVDKRTSTRQLANKLDVFEDNIKECVAKAPDVASKRAALVIWFEVKLHMLQRHQEKETALNFIREWLRNVCSEKLQDAHPGPLEQHLYTAAAICSKITEGSAKEQDELVFIHEGLEHFAGGEVDEKRAEQLLLDHPDIAFSSFLVGSEDYSLRGSLNKLLATETIRKRLSDILTCLKEGKIFDENSFIFSSKVGKAFLQILKRGRTQSYKEMLPGRPICAFCYFELTVQAQQHLKYFRIAQCSHCSRFTLNLEP